MTDSGEKGSETRTTKPKDAHSAQTRPHGRHSAFERELRVVAAEWFSRKGFDTRPRMSYCLRSHDDWPQNIICADVARYIAQEAERHRTENPSWLHKWLHHGLSSQAMVFNLIGPLIVRKDLEPLRDVIIEQVGVSWLPGDVTAELEYDDPTVLDEGSRRPTFFDIAVLGDGGRIFIEAKLGERDFGGCSVLSRGDCDGRNPILYGLDGCHLHHVGRRYWERMIEFGFDKTNLGSGHICPFAIYYQFFREILFALASDSPYILLHDERNPAFLRVSKKGKTSGLWPFLTESVPARFTASIGRITVQQLVAAIDESGRHHDWIDEFKSKYGIK